MDQLIRCSWCLQDQRYMDYHDHEWGYPVHDDRRLFEMLNLEGAQAGLSWYTVLIRRDNYRQAFDQWDAEKIARYDEQKKAQLLQDPGIIRNRLKIKAAVGNARAFLDLQDRYGSFDTFIWQFVDGKTIVNHWKTLQEVPATSAASDRMSRELKKEGFKFVGSTICYAFMQACGMVDDHTLDCWRRTKTDG